MFYLVPERGRIGLGQQPLERVGHEGRVAEKSVAVAIPAAHRLDHQMYRTRRAEPGRSHVVTFEDVEDLTDRRAAGTRRRRRDDEMRAVSAAERRGLGHGVLGKIAAREDSTVLAA